MYRPATKLRLLDSGWYLGREASAGLSAERGSDTLPEKVRENGRENAPRSPRGSGR